MTAGPVLSLFLAFALQSCSALERPQNLVELVATDQKDALKTWLASLEFHLPDSENSSTIDSTTAHFKYHDMVCKNLQFDRIHSDTFSSVGDPALELVVDGVSIECSGKFTSIGWISWLTVGSGSWSATLNNENGASFEILFERESDSPLLKSLRSIKCQVAFHSEVHVEGRLQVKTVNLLLQALSPFVNTFVQSQIQKKACDALDDLLQVKAPPYVEKVNKLFFNQTSPKVRRLDDSTTAPPTTAPPTTASPTTSPGGTVPNSSADSSANSSNSPVDSHHDPKLVDWTKSELLQWNSWFYEKVMPPEVARDLAKAAGSDFLTLDLTELPVPSFETTVDQHGALGLTMQIKVDVLEIQLKGMQGVQAYGIEAVSPSEMRFSLALGSEEYPVTTMAAKLSIKAEAKDTTSDKAAATLEEDVSFMIAVNKPKIASRMKICVGTEKLEKRYTLAQYIEDGFNCGRSFLTEAPVLEDMNVSFDSLSKPLSYTANTEGQLEQDISDFFNAMVKIFNELFEEHLPGAVARIATSKEAMDIANSLLKKQASPVECMSAKDAQAKIQGKYPEIYNNWPKLLHGQAHDYVDKMVNGLLETNETCAPPGWLEMPPINAAAFTNVHVKELKATGTHQIKNLKLFETDPKANETISFQMEAACPSNETPYRPMMVMTVEGTLDDTGDALVEVEFPCGTFQATLNLSVATLEAATMLMPPSLFCSLLSPFRTIAVANMTAIHGGPGKIYVTLGSGTRHDIIEELCGKYPRLCSLIGRVVSSVANKENATLVLSYLHQEAVGLCDEMIKAKGRRLSGEDGEDEPKRDALGVSYEEFSAGNLAFWLDIALSITIAGAVLLLVKRMEQYSLPRGNLHLAVHIIRSHGAALLYVIALLICLAICFRDLACNHLAYASIELTNLYKPSGRVLDSQRVAVFTFWGFAHQFNEVSAILGFEWAFNGWGMTLAISAIFIAILWIFRLPSTTQHILLRVALFFARRPWQETATFGLSALSMTSDLDLPVDVQGQMRLDVWSGPTFATLSTIFLSLAGVGMLVTLPLKSTDPQEDDGKKRIFVLLDLVLCSGIILGVLIWFFCNFVEVGMTGLAGTILDSQKFSGMELGNTSATLKVSTLFVFVIAPFMQACLVMSRVVGLRLMKNADVHRIVEEIFMSLNAFDIFALAFFVGFLMGVDGFTTSFVKDNFAVMCQTAKFVTDLECVGVDPKTVPFGSIGLAIGSFCTIGLYIRSSVKFHALVARPVRRRDEESNEETAAVELQ